MVRVLVAGVFNGPGQRALPWAEPDAVVEVADGEYARRLEAAGMVSLALTPRPLLPTSGAGEAEPGPSAAQVQPGPKARKRRGGG